MVQLVIFLLLIHRPNVVMQSCTTRVFQQQSYMPTSNKTVVQSSPCVGSEDSPEGRTLAAFDHLDHSQLLDLVMQSYFTGTTEHAHTHNDKAT